MMIPRDRQCAMGVWALLLTLCGGPATARDSASAITTAGPLVVPHTLHLELEHYAQRRGRGLRFETPALLDVPEGLTPFTWPRNSDLRARLLTLELRQAPLLGWIAANLYRSKRENGWCLEVDPGEGEYLVFYRKHLD